VTIEAGERREGSAFDLDDRDAQVGGVEHELLEGGPALGYDQQADRGTSRDECLLDRTPAGDEFLLGTERLRRRQGGRSGRTAAARVSFRAGIRAIGAGPRPVRSIAIGAAPVRASGVRLPSGRAAGARPIARAATVPRSLARSLAEAPARTGGPVIRFPRFVPGLVAALVGSAILPRSLPRTRSKSIARSRPRTPPVGPGT
jgi:hypothetical protein